MTHLVYWLRAVVFDLFLVLWTLVWGGGGLTTLLLPQPVKLRSARVVCRVWAKGVLYGLRVLCGIRSPGAGVLRHVREPCLVVSKHESAWETVFFLAHMRDVVYVVKQELLAVPIYGQYLRAVGMIAVDREARGGVRSMVRGICDALSQGKSVVIFPEGTRVLHGERGRCKSGVVLVLRAVRKVGCSVYTVALDSGRFWPKRRAGRAPGCVSVRIDPLILEEGRQIGASTLPDGVREEHGTVTVRGGMEGDKERVLSMVDARLNLMQSNAAGDA